MRGEERTRTGRLYGLDILKGIKFTNDFYQIPIMDKSLFIPEELIAFNKALTIKREVKGAFHCFLDDYQFERLWRDPQRYINPLKRAEAILSPDFSLYRDMSNSLQIYNVYRSRLIGSYYQKQGLEVIPTIGWSLPDSYDFCFLGVPKGSVIAISTVGIKRSHYAKALFIAGYEEMIKRLEPSSVLVYGGAIDYDLKGSNIIYYPNDNSKRWKEEAKENAEISN